MRIGVLTTSYPRASTDAAGIFVAGLARFLAREHEVEVIAAGPGGDRDGPIAIDRIDAPELFYGAGAPEALASSWRARAAVPAFVARLFARAVVRARRWDAVLSHWLVPCGLVGAMLRRPHVAIAHSGDVHLLERWPLAPLLARERLVFVSSDLRDRFARLVGRPVGEVIPMGTDVPELPAPTGPKSVLFLGRLVPIKGADVLVRAAEWLPEVRFVIAGNGPELPRLRAMAPANVRFPGPLHGDAKLAALAGAHVVCIPSRPLPDGRTEGAPVVAVEALAAGRPIVASATGGLPELVGDAGVLVVHSNPQALAEGLARALRETFPKRGRSVGWESIGPRFANLLQGRCGVVTVPSQEPLTECAKAQALPATSR